MATTTVLLMLGLLILLIILGVHIVLSLIVCSFLGIYLVLGSLHPALSLLQQTSYEGLRDYVFAVIPLFMLMGDFIARSGAAADLYKIVNHGLRRVPGRLAVATVALRQQYRGDAGAQRRQHLFLDAADRQHQPAQADLAGHRDVVTHRLAGHQRHQRRV